MAADLIVASGRIVGLATPRPDASGIAAPGFVDLQVNGFGGQDVATASETELLALAEELAQTGVTSFLPTVITGPADELVESVATIDRARTMQRTNDLGERRASGARILGAHVEGPFISPERLGVHPAEYRMDPDPEFMEELLAAGSPRLVTIAPELPGALDLIRRLRAAGVVVGLGHTNATSEQTRHALDAGASLTTHHGNVMRPFQSRDPGVFTTTLLDERCTIATIVDGEHLSPETVRLLSAVAGHRLALVTDSVAAEPRATTGPAVTAPDANPNAEWPDPSHQSPPGKSFADKPVRIEDGAVRLEDGTLAGSTLTMHQAVLNLIDLGTSPGDAFAAASTRPTIALDPFGANQGPVGMAAGAPADLVVVNDELELVRTMRGGIVIGE